MNSNYIALLYRYIDSFDNERIPYELIKSGEAPYSIYCYIRSEIENQKYKKKFSELNTINQAWVLNDFLSSYRGYFYCTLTQAKKELLQVSEMTVAEHACDTLKQLLNEFGLNHHLMADILGFEPSGLNKYFAGERAPYRELIMGICLFLELDLERTEKVMNECGLSLIDGFPDSLFKSYIENEYFNVQAYVDDVVLHTREQNKKRSELRAVSGRPTPRNIKLHSFYKSERPYPTSSVSAFRKPDGSYSYNRKEFI